MNEADTISRPVGITQSPWRVDKTNDGDYDIMGANGEFVATVHHDQGDRAANAALIVTAPELRDALQNLADAFTHPQLGLSLKMAIDKAREVISRSHKTI